MTLKKTPVMVRPEGPPTEAEEIVLQHLRPFIDNPELLFSMLDIFFDYYYDELT